MSESHQGGEGGVPQVTVVSDLLPMLSLWLLIKVSDHTESNC